LEGRRVGILNNGWSSMDVVARSLERFLKEDYGVEEVLHWHIPIARSVSPETLDEVVGGTDAAVVGLAN